MTGAIAFGIRGLLSITLMTRLPSEGIDGFRSKVINPFTIETLSFQ